MKHDALFAEVLKKSRTGIRGVNMKHMDVACRCDVDEYSKNRTITQAVSVVVPLSVKITKTISSAVGAQCADIIRRTGDINYQGFKFEEGVIGHEDFSFFKWIVYFSELSAAKNFMSTVIDGREEAQDNMIRHIRHWSELSRYRSSH